MNAMPPGEGIVRAEQAASPASAEGGFRARLSAVLFGRTATFALAGIALALGIATFVSLSGGAPFGPSPAAIVGLILASLAVLLLLGVSLVVRLVRVWAERRRRSAGSRLHVRLVLLFSVVATLPAILVAVFAALFFNLGIQAWFSDRVRTALEESLNASHAYLEEHRGNIRVEALAMANDMNRAAVLLPDNGMDYARVLATQTALRGLTETQVFDPITSQVVAHAGLSTGFVLDPVPAWAIDYARTGDVAVLSGEGDNTRVRALIALDRPQGLMLVIGRPVDPRVLNFAARAEAAVAQYRRLDQNRWGLQITFALIFAIVALLVLAAASLVGLMLANQIARPLGALIQATERVRAGEEDVRVEEDNKRDDDIGALSRAFNRMTHKISSQRGELMNAYSQIDERRRFTETVLSGVSAGVIGLDAKGQIELPNRVAGELLARDLTGKIGERLADVVPEFAPLFAQVAEAPERPRTAEVVVGPPQQRQTLLVRIGAEVQNGSPKGYVVTFDDITELQSAQRKAAWADVARRIAHEIKNPLTPIQLSAERLKRRFLKEIASDPDTFRECADTIVRQVGDIGRMVDEFSAFARMPHPVMKPEDLGRVVREALVLQRNAHPEIAWQVEIPEDAPKLPCDRRQIGQAVTNLLQNAADAVSMREGAGGIRVVVAAADGVAQITIEDDGIGLPAEDRARLTEPYVTHKAKGTGLGLAIVKKIMEDHGGRLVMEDRDSGPGARVSLLLPLKETAREHA